MVVNCVLDTASQCTYLNSRAIQGLGYDPESLSVVHYDVHSFAGIVSRPFKQIYVDTDLLSMPIPVLINDELDIEFNIPQFKTILRNLRRVSKIATNYPNKDQLKLDGIIGMDIIEPMNYSTIKVMNGKVYLFHNGIVP